MPYKGSEKERACKAAWAKANPEKERARKAAWAKANPEKERARKAAWNAAHPEERKALTSAWRAANPEKVKAWKARWYAANREEVKARSAAWAKANPEKAKASVAASQRAHPEVRRTVEARRKARKKALPATLTVEQWEGILAAYKHKCAYCGKKETKKRPLTQDHVIPLSKHGGTTSDNIVPACGRCNSKKGDKPPDGPVKLVLV